MQTSALLSPCRTYRYHLERVWNAHSPRLLWVMLNPSTADQTDDDPTIRRCIGFARREGYGGIEVVNLFGLRATYPADIWGHPDPVGPENDRYLRETFAQLPLAVCAWGAVGGAFGILTEKWTRDKTVWRMLMAANVSAYCLGVTGAGHPKHPLYLAANTALERYEGPQEAEALR
jgi:hypothetical protein